MNRLLALAFIACILAKPISAEAFGNNAVFLPKLGMAFYDQLNLNHKPWGIKYQYSIGTAFMQALNYRWWWIAESNFGMGLLDNTQQDFLSSFIGGLGLRYNIFPDDFRPHTGLMLHYLQFFGNATKNMTLNIDLPLFVGFKPYFGLEWVFSEMALLLEGGYGLYFNIYEPFRQVLYAQASWTLYF